ncbi:MAG: polysaccharide biosynthesis tyrosine autokinase [Candidatus Coproplasma sp.]
MENYEEEEKSISIGALFKYLWKNIILFAAVFVGVLVIGLVYSFAIIKPTYKSSATFVVAVKTESDNPENNNIDYVNSFRLIETVASLVTEDVVLKPVAEEYNIIKKDLKEMVSVKYGDMNYLVSLSVENHDKVLSKNLANSLVTRLIDVTTTTTGLEFLKGTITQTSEAEEGEYAKPSKMMCVLVSGVAALCIACVVVAIKELCSTKFRTRKEIESRLSAKVMGYFPENMMDDRKDKEKNKKNTSKAKLLKRDLKTFEPYNALLSNIKYSNLESPNKVIMFTSSHEDEWKSTSVCNLASCIAYNGQKVAIIDLDMRKPVINKVFGVSGDNGIADLFAGTCEFDDIIKHSDSGVDVITAGKNIINPMAIIGHKALPELLSKLKGMYDYVIVDTAPVLPCADAIAIAPLCDGVIFTAAMKDVHKKEAEAAVASLRAGGANIIGINVTKGTESKVDGGYNYYNYYGKEYGSPELLAEAAVTDGTKKTDD